MTQEFFDVHHISFDVWLTLIRSNPEFKKERDLLFKDFFSLPHPVEEISTHFRQWDKRFTAINEITGKNIDAEEMVAIVLSSLEHDFKGVDPHILADFFQQQEELFTTYHPILIEDKLENYLGVLAESGITMSILSNTGFIKGRTLRALLDHLKVGSYFSFQLYSDEINCSKPSAEAFSLVHKEVLEKKRSLEKNNILHIGDNSYADIVGAENAGMQSALINSNNISLLSLSIFKEKVTH